jgi:hypothetical protein
MSKIAEFHISVTANPWIFKREVVNHDQPEEGWHNTKISKLQHIKKEGLHNLQEERLSGHSPSEREGCHSPTDKKKKILLQQKSKS